VRLSLRRLHARGSGGRGRGSPGSCGPCSAALAWATPQQLHKTTTRIKSRQRGAIWCVEGACGLRITQQVDKAPCFPPSDSGHNSGIACACAEFNVFKKLKLKTVVPSFGQGQNQCTAIHFRITPASKRRDVRCVKEDRSESLIAPESVRLLERAVLRVRSPHN
jgi:hypothetical protein